MGSSFKKARTLGWDQGVEGRQKGAAVWDVVQRSSRPRRKLWGPPKPGPFPLICPLEIQMAWFSSSKELDCLGLLASFRTLVLKAKGFFCSVCSLEEGKTSSRGWLALTSSAQEAEPPPSLHRLSLQPCPSSQEPSLCAESVWPPSSQEQSGGCNAGAIKGTIFRPHFNLIQHRQWDARLEGGQTKGDAGRNRLRQVGQGKDKEISVQERKKCPEVQARDTRGVLLTGNHYCITGGVMRKNAESAVTSKKRLGQSVPGELVKNTLPWPIWGRPSPNIRVGRGNVFLIAPRVGDSHTQYSLRTRWLESIYLWNLKEWSRPRGGRSPGGAFSPHWAQASVSKKQGPGEAKNLLGSASENPCHRDTQKSAEKIGANSSYTRGPQYPRVTGKIPFTGALPGGPMVKPSPSNAGGAGSTPGLGAKIPFALWPKSQNIK